MKHNDDDELVTRKILREEFAKSDKRFDEKLDAGLRQLEVKLNDAMDAKIEIMCRRMLEDFASVVYDFMQEHSEFHFTVEKREQKERERGIKRSETRLDAIEARLSRAAKALR